MGGGPSRLGVNYKAVDSTAGEVIASLQLFIDATQPVVCAYFGKALRDAANGLTLASNVSLTDISKAITTLQTSITASIKLNNLPTDLADPYNAALTKLVTLVVTKSVVNLKLDLPTLKKNLLNIANSLCVESGTAISTPPTIKWASRFGATSSSQNNLLLIIILVVILFFILFKGKLRF